MAKFLICVLTLASSYAVRANASFAPRPTCDSLSTAASATSAAAATPDATKHALWPAPHTPTAPYEAGNATNTSGAPTGSLAHGSAPASDVWVTEIVTSYTTFCPKATSLLVNGHTYTATESETLTITHCPGGCRLTRPASAVSAETVTALIPDFTTTLAGPTTASLVTALHTLSETSTLTVSACPGGCTVTTALSALISAANPEQPPQNTVDAAPTGPPPSPAAPTGPPPSAAAPTGLPPSSAAPISAAGTGVPPSGAINGTGSHFTSTGFAARPTTQSSPSPVQSQVQTGDASTNTFGFGIVVLAWLVATT